jgi:hypothetical protein
MKKVLSRLTGILALAFLAAHAVEAQEPVLVNIPFAFTAGRMALPAGEYRVEKMGEASALLLIQRTDGSAATFVISNGVEANRPQTHSKLIFHCYGNQYFLSQIWVEGHSLGRELAPSAKEKEQRGLLARKEAPDQVTIVARLISPKP